MPSYFKHPNRFTRNMHQLSFHQVHVSIDYYRYSFFPMSLILWNGLPSSVVVLDDLDSFKREVSKISYSWPTWGFYSTDCLESFKSHFLCMAQAPDKKIDFCFIFFWWGGGLNFVLILYYRGVQLSIPKISRGSNFFQGVGAGILLLIWKPIPLVIFQEVRTRCHPLSVSPIAVVAGTRPQLFLLYNLIIPYNTH